MMTEIQPVNPALEEESRSPKIDDRVADPHLSVAATARALRISPTTLRRYIKEYQDHVDALREGGRLMIAVSSIPTLAQIRDLRARKFSREDIESILFSVPGKIALPYSLDSIEAATRTAVKEGVDAALGDLRAELESLKRATLDSDVVVRQSLANIVFLIDKFGRELQFHVSEERIASNERDLRLARNEEETRLLMSPQINRIGLVSRAANLYRRLFAGLISRRSAERP